MEEDNNRNKQMEVHLCKGIRAGLERLQAIGTKCVKRKHTGVERVEQLAPPLARFFTQCKNLTAECEVHALPLSYRNMQQTTHKHASRVQCTARGDSRETSSLPRPSSRQQLSQTPTQKGTTKSFATQRHYKPAGTHGHGTTTDHRHIASKEHGRTSKTMRWHHKRPPTTHQQHIASKDERLVKYGKVRHHIRTPHPDHRHIASKEQGRTEGAAAASTAPLFRARSTVCVSMRNMVVPSPGACSMFMPLRPLAYTMNWCLSNHLTAHPHMTQRTNYYAIVAAGAAAAAAAQAGSQSRNVPHVGLAKQQSVADRLIG